MRTKHLRLLAIPTLLLPLALACGTEQEQPVGEAETTTEMMTETPMAAPAEMGQGMMATLVAAPGSNVSGTVRFEPAAGGVRVIADLQGVDGAGPHGFHIHQTGECTPPDFKSAGGHFNPGETDHACPPTTPRHAGDLGNIEIGEDGSGHLELTSDMISLDPGAADSIVGKAVVLHAGEDDCTSQPSGDSGARVACGVIETSGMGMQGGMGMDSGMGGGMNGMQEHMDTGQPEGGQRP